MTSKAKDVPAPTVVRATREELLKRLLSVLPGVAERESVEQSTSVVLKGGWLVTYNDEVSCRCPSALPKKFAGAVRAAPLVNLLQKMTEEEVELALADGELLVKGKKRKAGIVMDAEVRLAIEAVERPAADAWSKLPADFVDALDIVVQCASRDDTRFSLTCVHITPRHIEACDNHQLTRYKIKLGVKVPMLVKHKNIKHLLTLGVDEVAETDNWLHFRNADGLEFSCRRYLEEFPDLDAAGAFKVDGAPAALPKGLADSVELAEIFSKEAADDNHVMVELRPGRLRLVGQGASGWYAESRALPGYDGKPIKFLIAPKLLVELTKRHDACEIGPERLKVDGGKFTYVACLGLPDADGGGDDNGGGGE